MKTKITLKLDSEILHEIRILAAEQGISVSGLLATKVEEIVRRRKAYARAPGKGPSPLEQGRRPVLDKTGLAR